MTCTNEAVTYEAFGAIGDGVADDLPAICKAHEHANANGLRVRANPTATYHLGRQALTVEIATDTDWNTARFTIDDTEVDDHRQSLFHVRSLLEPVEIQLDRLARDQKQVDVHPDQDCFVFVQSDSHRVYIRRGLNQNKGVAQHDCFILRRDGSIEGDVDWDYDQFSKTEARPIDEQTLTLKGGVFNTIANRMRQDKGYNYWLRNIRIDRSNTVVDGLVHYIVGETKYGHPYSGFLSAGNCANITFRNCFATPHKIYRTIGAAGKPVSMGSYDYGASNVVNFHLQNCRMNLITDRTRWGVIATNFCKNILLEDCALSRMDTHMGVSGTYTIRRCELGHMGLNAIGRGQLTVEDSTLYGGSLMSFRSDYGSTWEGTVAIRNSRWIPACGGPCWPSMLNMHNDGMHDFGYPCSMPREVTVDGLFVDDSNVPDDYTGMYLLNDPDGKETTPPADRPFPYARCETITVRGLTTASGKPAQLPPGLAAQGKPVVLK
jgi:hypothetical protein